MSDACCPTPPPEQPADRSAVRYPCPSCGREGPPVDHSVLAALVTGRVPRRQGFRLCRSRHCGTVYHGDAGAVFGVGDLRVVPGFKDGSGGLVCYCFLHTEDDMAREMERTGEITIPARIRARIDAGDCACEVRNPSGRCCLGQVERAAERIRERLAAPGGE